MAPPARRDVRRRSRRWRWTMSRCATRSSRLRDELESIGPVNALAVEEHDEEAKRLDFLTTQRTDLVSAKNSLHQAIREIDVTARALFLDDVRAGAHQLPPDLPDALRRRRVRPAPRGPGPPARLRHRDPRVAAREAHAAHPPALERRARARRARRCSSASSSPSRAPSACSTRWTRRSTTRTSAAS